MRRTVGDGREYAVMTHAGRRLEVHPDVWDALNFMLTDPNKSAKIEIGVMSGNVANVHINGLAAKSLRHEAVIQEPIYQFGR